MSPILESSDSGIERDTRQTTMSTPENDADLKRQAADTLHVEMIPGTEIMRDVDNIHFSHAKGSQETVLLTGVTVITLGYANFIIVPLSNIFGRRPISIIFAVLIVLTCIWEALATSHSSLLAARALNGVVCATSESIMVQVIADVFFLHERGLWTGVYFTGYFLGAFLGPVMSGNIAARHGWRSFFWLEVALSVFAAIVLVVSFPETKFHREHPTRAPSSMGGSMNSYGEPMEKRPSVGERHAPGGEHPATSSPSLVGLGRPGKVQFSAYQKPDSRWKMFIVRDTITPIRVFFNPIIFWAGLMLAGPADLVLLWNLTESQFLSGPPYNWNPSQVGYANFSFVIGGLVGLATAGPFSDWVAKRATKRNNGIREAEMRLPALIPYLALTVIAIVVGGLGYERLWPWQAILVLGYALSGLAVTTVPTIAIAYAIDCYKPISGEIMVVATVLKNTLGFAYSYWVFGLAAQQGFLTVAMVQFAVTIGPALFAIPLYFYGKSLRRWTKNSDLHRMEEMI
ncbi:hypothetical protein LTR04_007027 [Oleoguttula sp. CCFEE 6159]|nr:hypothetical protein LTR04_007027 [Oleoguttula sp. CCFEE 6159]